MRRSQVWLAFFSCFVSAIFVVVVDGGVNINATVYIRMSMSFTFVFFIQFVPYADVFVFISHFLFCPFPSCSPLLCVRLLCFSLFLYFHYALVAPFLLILIFV